MLFSVCVCLGLCVNVCVCGCLSPFGGSLWWPCFDPAGLPLILQQMRAVQGGRGLFGGLQRATVLGLEDQIEGLAI